MSSNDSRMLLYIFVLFIAKATKGFICSKIVSYPFLLK